MHTELIEKATKEQLSDFLLGEFEELKSSDPAMKRELECRLYEAVYGPHFSELSYDKAVSGMENADGTKGPHWGEAEIRDYASSRGVSFSKYNEWDFAYAMNMAYSDYRGVIPDSTESYFRVAKAFLEDKDAPEGKAYLYWKAMQA